MAYNFVRASAQKLTLADTSAYNVPLTLQCRFNVANITEDHELLSYGNSGASREYWVIAARGDQANDPVFAQTVVSAGNSLSSAGTFTASAWHHAAGVFASATSRIAYFNGVAGTENTTSRAPALGANQEFVVGHNAGTTINVYMAGNVAEPAIWNVALTASEIAALAKGVSPLQIRPSALIYYAPIVRDLLEWTTGTALTNVNAATVAAHAPVMPPYAWAMNRSVFVPAAAGGAVLRNFVRRKGNRLRAGKTA